MASESQDSRRKHRRSSSPDEEAERSSKRHKHRHHHHRHRHRSKKHAEETKPQGEDINPNPPLPFPVSHVVNKSRLDDDVEEGEILEEEGFGGGGEDEIAKKKFESDDESGEIVAVRARDESDQPNLVCSGCSLILFIVFFSFNFLSVWLLRKLRIFRLHLVLFFN